MNISLYIDECFQIIDVVDIQKNNTINILESTAPNIFDKVSSHVTRIIGGLVHRSLETNRMASVEKLFARNGNTSTFLTISTQIVKLASIDKKILLLFIQQNNENLEGNLSELIKENTDYSPLMPDNEQQFWDFLESAEVTEMEEVETEHDQQKVNERLELLLREAEKQGLEWIKTMNDLTLSMIKLKESEQTKKALLDAVPDAMFQVNKEGYYLEYIPAKDETTIPAAAFIGNNMKDILPEEYAPQAMEELKLSLETAMVRDYSFEWELEDNLRYFEIRFSPLNELEALCMIRDITKQKRGEELLRKSVLHYQDLIRRSPAPILILDRDSKFIDANPAALLLIGVEDIKQLKNRRGYDFIHKNDKSIVKDKLKRGFNDNFPEGVARFLLVNYNEEEIAIEVAAAIMNLGGKRVAQLVLREVK
ncbi:MAG: PAS domain-containing protein [Chitinophagales bacterium]